MCRSSKKIGDMTGKVILNIFGMLSSESAIEIDNTLEKVEGVIESSTSSVLQQTEVTFDPKITNLSKIITEVRKLGYDVEIMNGTVQ